MIIVVIVVSIIVDVIVRQRDKSGHGKNPVSKEHLLPRQTDKRVRTQSE